MAMKTAIGLAILCALALWWTVTSTSEQDETPLLQPQYPIQETQSKPEAINPLAATDELPDLEPAPIPVAKPQPKPPKVNAGHDVTMDEDGTVTLEGFAQAADGGEVRYHWMRTAAFKRRQGEPLEEDEPLDNDIKIRQPYSATPLIRVPDVTKDRWVTLYLVATDSKGNSAGQHGHSHRAHRPLLSVLSGNRHPR